MIISSEVLEEIKKEVKCRNDEIDLLNSFLNGDVSTMAPSLIVHGYKSIGKTYTIKHYLEALGIKKTIINCDECVTKKILLQRCFKRIRIDSGVDLTTYNQIFNYKGMENSKFGSLCENFASFIIALEQFIEETKYQEPHVLVLDRFDQCMDQVDELFPAFLRLQEQSNIRNISIIFIISTDIPKEIAANSVPRIFFKSYSQDEVVEILQSNQLCLFQIEEIDNSPIGNEFWKNYSKLVVDLFFAYTGSDMKLLIDIASKLWDNFIAPIIQGRYKPHEFIKVYRENQYLFSNDNILNNTSIKEYGTLEEEIPANNGDGSDLPNHSKFILIASYLASFNEPKSDLHYFSKLKGVKGRKHKVSNLVKVKKGHLLKGDIDTRLLSPNYFDLERLLAIISVTYRNESESLNKSNEYLNFYEDLTEKEMAKKEQELANFTLHKNIDLNSQIATLASLGLLTRTSASDILNPKVRWKCNMSWQTVESIAKDINFPLQNYLAE